MITNLFVLPDFAPGALKADSILTFTFHYTESGAWEGKDFEIRVFDAVMRQAAPLAGN
jgi:hypothetical protein